MYAYPPEVAAALQQQWLAYGGPPPAPAGEAAPSSALLLQGLAFPTCPWDHLDALHQYAGLSCLACCCEVQPVVV